MIRTSVIAVTGLLGLLAPVTHAAPVMFKFEAEIESLPPFNDDIDLPFTLNEGSTISGSITIDADLNGPPFGNSSQSAQAFAIEFLFEGIFFGTNFYSTTVVNDSPIADSPIAGPTDSVMIACSPTSAVACSPSPLVLPGAPPLELLVEMQFLGNASLLDEPRLPQDVNTWNGFTIKRSARLVFVGMDGRSALYDATLSQFVVIPEPASSLSLVSLLLVAPFIIRRRKKKGSPPLFIGGQSNAVQEEQIASFNRRSARQWAI